MEQEVNYYCVIICFRKCVISKPIEFTQITFISLIHVTKWFRIQSISGMRTILSTNPCKYTCIFTMVSYFLCWALLKIFSSFSNAQSQQKVRQWSRITCAVINTSIEAKCPLLWEFWIYNFSRRILERVFVGSIVNIRNECLFSLGSWGMNRSAEQTNRTRNASRFTRFVCPALRFIPHEPRKKTLIP